MHKGDRHAALADRRRNPLDGTKTDVAAREDARDARLEKVRVALEGPALGSARVRAYTYFAIPYSEVRTLCETGTVEYRVLRRRPRRDT